MMKYLNFRSSGSKLESVKCRFTENRTPSQVFFKEFLHKCRIAMLKMHLDGCFWGQLDFADIREWRLLKDSCKDIFILEILTVTHILCFQLWHHVKEERVFMGFFSKGSGEKCKHAELALNFIQKQYFSEKDTFPLYFSRIPAPWTSKKLFSKFSIFKGTLRPLPRKQP